MIIGPVAWDEAKKVQGVRVVDQSKGEVALDKDGKTILDRLVGQYTKLFGQVSIEVCKDAVQDLLVELPKDQVPQSLQ